MTKAIQKITLSPSRDIPFNKLVLSQSNLRRVKAGVSIEQLAESIAQHTLLQSLNVRAVVDGEGNETGMFEVPAGGRRYRALELLVKQKRMAKTQRALFHGGVAGLEISGFILPPDETGRDGSGWSNRVYLTTDLLEAVFAARLERGMVYLVRPIGRLGPDDNGTCGPHYTARRALILNRAPLPQRVLDFDYGTDFNAFIGDMTSLRYAICGSRRHIRNQPSPGRS